MSTVKTITIEVSKTGWIEEPCDWSPGEHRLVDATAHEAVCKERDALKVMVDFQNKQARCQPDFKDEYDNLSKFTEDLRKERDALAAQLAEVERDAELEANNANLAKKESLRATERIARLERALAYAKDWISEFTNSAAVQGLEQIEDLERGD